MINWKKRVVTLLLQSKNDKALKLRNKHIPKSLFRFRKCDDRQFKTLENLQVFMPSPKDFNDYYFDSRADPSWIFLFLRNISRLSEKIKLPEGYTNPLLSEITKLINNINSLIECTENCKIVCFTTDIYSPQMWGYYNNHEGFCIEYSFDGLGMDDLRRRLLYPVLYTRLNIVKFFIYNLFYQSNSCNYPILAAMHKDRGWAHEKEWRIIRPPFNPIEPKNGDLLFMPIPVGIYLGARISDENRDKLLKSVRNIEKQRSVEIRIYEMKADFNGLRPNLISDHHKK